MFMLHVNMNYVYVRLTAQQDPTLRLVVRMPDWCIVFLVETKHKHNKKHNIFAIPNLCVHACVCACISTRSAFEVRRLQLASLLRHAHIEIQSGIVGKPIRMLLFEETENNLHNVYSEKFHEIVQAHPMGPVRP